MGPTDEPNVSVCLTCHGPSAVERLGAGRASPLSLSDITHPSHLYSEVFLGEYRGNCMSCHSVSEDGVWQVLSEAVEVNEKGVPSPVQLPIPGLLNPRAGP
jgi:mono/diheme cytochrome c family protein